VGDTAHHRSTRPKIAESGTLIDGFRSTETMSRRRDAPNKEQKLQSLKKCCVARMLQRHVVCFDSMIAHRIPLDPLKEEAMQDIEVDICRIDRKERTSNISSAAS
jgi:hypothetical protein